MKAIAPGKLILSGEHAVVYGHPALAMAVDRYAEAIVTPQLNPLVSFDLLNLSYHKSHTIQALKSLKRRLKGDYEKFLKGEHSIKDVLKTPFELSQMALTTLAEKLNFNGKQGIKLRTHSTIPIGCGMGSSAAMILCVMHAMNCHSGHELTHEQYLSIGLEVENLQHGNSSGLDLHISLKGGCMLYQEGEYAQRNIPDIPMYLVNTGKPLANTGECVSHAAQYFQQSCIGDDFAAITHALDQALQDRNFSESQRLLRENHQLLCNIDVVPCKVQQFISKIEAQGDAAKICGAGNIKGDNGGIVVVFAEREPTALCQEFDYSVSKIIGEHHGLRAA